MPVASDPSSSSGANSCDVAVIAASLGGLCAIESIVAALPGDFPIPLVVVQHLSDRHPTHFVDLVGAKTSLSVRWLEHREPLRRGVVHVAPPGSHATIDSQRKGSLSYAPRVNYARPAADVLFTSAAMHFGRRAIGVVLTGRLFDGASGALAIRRAGGVVIAQDPATCAAPGMPRAAIAAGAVHFVLSPNGIAQALIALAMAPGTHAMFGWNRAA